MQKKIYNLHLLFINIVKNYICISIYILHVHVCHKQQYYNGFKKLFP